MSTDWPDELDALVAAPAHHTLLFESDEVRVLDARIGPGDTVPVHTHRWPGALYVLAGSDFVRREADGAVLLDSRETGAPAVGSALWTPPLPPHTLENVGSSELRVISVELKQR